MIADAFAARIGLFYRVAAPEDLDDAPEEVMKMCVWYECDLARLLDPGWLPGRPGQEAIYVFSDGSEWGG